LLVAYVFAAAKGMKSDAAKIAPEQRPQRLVKSGDWNT
jgi:hypothetical protein